MIKLSVGVWLELVFTHRIIIIMMFVYAGFEPLWTEQPRDETTQTKYEWLTQIII